MGEETMGCCPAILVSRHHPDMSPVLSRPPHAMILPSCSSHHTKHLHLRAWRAFCAFSVQNQGVRMTPCFQHQAGKALNLTAVPWLY